MTPPPLRPYQVEDLEWLRTQPYAALFWEQRLGKTRVVVEHVKEHGFKLAVVITPAMARNVWESEESDVALCDPMAGRFSFPKGYTNKILTESPQRDWVVVSYEAIARESHFKALRDLLKEHRPDICILDETSYIMSHSAERTHAAIKLAHLASRRIILNGTPIRRDEMNLWAQYEALSPEILGCKNFYQFRARHAQMGGFKGREVVKIINREQIYDRARPYTRRRLRADHLKDLPPKTYLLPLEVPLLPSTWKQYTDMRDEMVAWFEAQPSIAISGGIAALRLAQIAAGFLGGLEGQEGWVDNSFEKTDAIVNHLEDGPWDDNPIVWCRFRGEIARLVKWLSNKGWDVYEIHGSVSETKKTEAKKAFRVKEDRFRNSKLVLVAHPAAAAMGIQLNASRAHYFLSQDFNSINRWQAEDRSQGPGQVVSYQDVLATGPKGQMTVDHKIRRVLQERTDTSKLSSAEWIKLLKEE